MIQNHFNSFPASDNFFRLLISFANSLNQDQARQNQSGSKLFDTVVVFLKDFSEKVNSKKNPQMAKKLFTQHAKS